MNLDVITSWLLLGLILFGLYLVVLLTLRAIEYRPGHLNKERAQLIRQAVTYAKEDMEYFPGDPRPAHRVYTASQDNFEIAVGWSLACFPSPLGRQAYLTALKRQLDKVS